MFGAEVPPMVVFLLFGEVALLAAYTVAWILARTHRGSRHHYVMLFAFAIEVLVFKPLMLSRALETFGPFPWRGTDIIYHFLLDIVVVVLGGLNIYFGFRFRVKKGGKMFMPPKGRLHRVVGSVFLVAWFVTFVLGVRLFAWAYIP